MNAEGSRSFFRKGGKRNGILYIDGRFYGGTDMKVLAINGSPHAKGAVYTAIRLVADELEEQGIEVEIVHIGDQAIHGCIDCGYCRSGANAGCVFTDDPMNECLAKMRDADGLILASPVYYGGVAGAMKSFLDCFFFAGPDVAYKAGAAIVTLRRSGAVDTYHQLLNYMNLKNMVIAPGPYWPAMHGMDSGEVLSDKEGIEIMTMIGRNMAWLMKTLESGRGMLPPPGRIPAEPEVLMEDTPGID